MIRLRSRLAAAVLCCASAPALAGSVTLVSDGANSTENTGSSYSVVAAYTGVTPTLGLIQFEVTNTTPSSVGGFLTAFAFNLPPNILGVTGFSAPGTNFGPIFSVSASPYADFDAGASTGGSFLGGGPPQRGLAPGATAVFSYGLSGTSMDDPSLEDVSAFLAETSAAPNRPGTFFIGRFRGLNNGGSDKVPAFFDEEGPDTTDFPEIPEPGSASLFGLGLLAGGIFSGRRRRRAARAAAADRA